MKTRVAVLVLALVASACTGPTAASGPTEGGVVGSEDSVELIDRSGPFTVSVFHEHSNGVVDVDLVAPLNAAEVQIAFEPTFANAPWTSVGNIDLMTLSTGVQEFFARYRASDGSTVGTIDTRALSILPQLTPLTGSVANAENVRVTKVSNDVLQLDLIIGEVTYEETGQAWLAGPDVSVDQWGAWNTFVTVDGSDVAVTEVGRQSWPVGNIDFDTFAMRHRVHIRLAEPLTGDTAEVTLEGFADAAAGAISNSDFSPAVRINELGWGSADEKVGYVTVWSALSSPITDVDGTTARVVDADSGEEVLTVAGAGLWPGKRSRRTMARRSDRWADHRVRSFRAHPAGPLSTVRR